MSVSRCRSRKHACAAIVTRFSSSITRPPAPSNGFSSMKHATSFRSSACSSFVSVSKSPTFFSMMASHSGGNGRSRTARRVQRLKKLNTPPSIAEPGTLGSRVQRESTTAFAAPSFVDLAVVATSADDSALVVVAAVGRRLRAGQRCATDPRGLAVGRPRRTRPHHGRPRARGARAAASRSRDAHRREE